MSVLKGTFNVKGSGKGVMVYGGGGGGMATGIFQTEHLQGQTKNGNTGELCRKGPSNGLKGLPSSDLSKSSQRAHLYCGPSLTRFLLEPLSVEIPQGLPICPDVSNITGVSTKCKNVLSF